MGAVASRVASASGLKGLVSRAGLPLQVDDDFDKSDIKEPSKPPPPSSYTQAYDCKDYFTGVKSSIKVKRPPQVVYDSLSSNIHNVFTPMTECHDEDREVDAEGVEKLFRVVRIPFRVAVVTGNLKLRMHVRQCRKAGEITFLSAKSGRLISKFEAVFHLNPPPGQHEVTPKLHTGAGHADETEVILDAKIACSQLPPPPFKGLVKSVMIHKIDACMLDLLDFHTQDAEDQRRASLGGRKKSGKLVRTKSQRTKDGEAARRKSLGESLSSHPVPDEPSTP